MLQSFPRSAAGRGRLSGACRWIDLLDPTPEEVALVRETFQVEAPTRRQLEEIEATSRLRTDGETIYMSAPMIAGEPTERGSITPTGFILRTDLCVTVRFAEMPAFDTVIDDIGERDDITAAEVFARLLEEVIDRAADQLEYASAKVAEASGAVFFDDRGRGLSRNTAVLRSVMREIGRASDRASRVRYVFLNMDRLVAFVVDRCEGNLADLMPERLAALRHDIASLDEFELSLSSRIQLLQDSAAGFISIEQNEVVKVLTVASVVGVPPVLVVGVYGMNFRHMPELAWPLGYPFALLLCVLSAVVPLIWFKWRGWL
jgi:magnesium transporter